MGKAEEEGEEEKENKELREAMRFEGGTLYQGFLGALSYHRWHAPVAGTVEKVRKIQGTYFAGCPGLASRRDTNGGGEERKLDPSAPDRSQRYLCQVGTRALVFIRARDKRLGTVVFVAVGMAEVSSCQVTVWEGDLVEKGEEIGMVSLRSLSFGVKSVVKLRWAVLLTVLACIMQFHYGGSTHCLIFEPSVRLKFIDAVEQVDVKKRGNDLNLPVNGYLAEVVS